MQNYLDLITDILESSIKKDDRTGTGTLSVFGRQLRYDLAEGFPLVTTKKVHFKSIAHELIWLISGSQYIYYLQKNGVTIWDEWADIKGFVGRIYGYQWRSWGGYADQLSQVIEQIKINPDSRRLIVSAWNVGELAFMALPPCHILFQFYVADNKLSCMMTQRSADVFLGLPFNIASYALLTQMIAQICNLQLGELIISMGDAHLYSNHLEQAKLQLTRKPLPLPTAQLNTAIKDIDSFKYEDITLVNHQSHPPIYAEVSI